MDLKSARLIKLKAVLFVVMMLMCSGLLLMSVAPVLSWQVVIFYLLSLWSACRAYYFCFYVLHHYVDPTFRYTGLLDLCLYVSGWKKN